MKFGFNQYFEPTPKKLRMLGDALIAAGTFGGSLTILQGNPQAGTVIVIVSVLGKFLSNFFSNGDEPKVL